MRRGGPLLGVALNLAALLLFVCMDTLVKLLTARYAVPQLMWARFLFGFIVVALVLRATSGHFPWRSRAPVLQTVRSLLLACCNLMFSTALAEKSFASASSMELIRNTLGPAPVAATRTPPAAFATKTPTMA